MSHSHPPCANPIPVLAVQKEISSLDSNLVFGASLDLDLLGIEIDDETLIPGLAVASSRSKPLAGEYSLKYHLWLFLCHACYFLHLIWILHFIR